MSEPLPFPRDATAPDTGEAALPEGVALRPDDIATPLDLTRLGPVLAEAGIALRPGHPARQFAGGLANLNYLLAVEGGWAVLRRPPAGPRPPGANDMAREHRILSRLWRVLPLAPRSLLLCEDPGPIGVPFQILEFRPGVVVRGDGLAPLPETAETGRRLSQAMIAALAQIHAVDPAAAGLEGLGRPEGFFGRQVAGWAKRAAAVNDGTPPAAAREVLAWLERCPEPDGGAPVLLHCDFKLDNLLLDPATLIPGTVVDWDMGTRGPALFDLATLLSYWTEADDPDCMHRLAQMPTARPGFATREGAAAAWSAATGRPLDDLRPFRVLATLKLGVVFQQLHALYRQGLTTDPRYVGFGALGADLFDIAREVAHGRLF